MRLKLTTPDLWKRMKRPEPTSVEFETNAVLLWNRSGKIDFKVGIVILEQKKKRQTHW